MGSRFGQAFAVQTFGESHGPAVGVVIDGCPPLLPVTAELIQAALDRRRPGQSRITTQRQEADAVEILSGVEDGLATGAPIALLVRNADQRSRDYEQMRDTYRPSHADFAYDEKYGIRSWSGGGRASARETIGRVAAGALAEELLRLLYGASIVAFVDRVQDISIRAEDFPDASRDDVDANIARCPDPAVAEQMIGHIEAVRKEGDSVGGSVWCQAVGIPAGLGDPVFDKLEADLAKAMMSLPASKGFEIGSGFEGTRLRGSEHNDPYRADDDGQVTAAPNRSGGIQGGISIGMPITMRVSFKPVATIMRDQDTVNQQRENATLKGKGRHDPCVLPRAVPMVEAMAALVLADHALRQEGLLAVREGLRRPDERPLLDAARRRPQFGP
jgi:chorismate synthase